MQGKLIKSKEEDSYLVAIPVTIPKISPSLLATLREDIEKVKSDKLTKEQVLRLRDIFLPKIEASRTREVYLTFNIKNEGAYRLSPSDKYLQLENKLGASSI